jgi:hypothetical protein
MDRHTLYALLAPLLVTAVAMPSTMAHAAAPAAPAAVPEAACALVAAPGTNPQEFDLNLTGFGANQNVNITGPENFTVTTDGQGASTTEDVKKGNYTAKPRGGQNNQNRSVGCTKPARTPSTTTTVKISDVEIQLAFTDPNVIDCSKPHNVTFTGMLTGTGRGDTAVKWTSGGRTTDSTVKFTEPTSGTVFVARYAGRSAPSTSVPKVTASLVAGNASDDRTFSVQCSPGT